MRTGSQRRWGEMGTFHGMRGAVGTDDTTVPSMAWEGTVFAPKPTVLLGCPAEGQ